MSWIQRLYETYDNCQSMVGVEEDAQQVPLLPLCHSSQMAQIEIVLDQQSNFKRAAVVHPQNARTIIPCTESSAGRAGIKPGPHPLCDKLQYVARDLPSFGGTVTKGFENDPTEPFQNYASLLGAWCDSSFSHPKALAIFKYVMKGQVIRDLVDAGVLVTDKKGRLLETWKGKKGEQDPQIFKVWGGQMGAFVRWIVEIPGDPAGKVWLDRSLWQSWSAYYSASKANRALCYVTGEEAFAADQHPAKLRHDADKAKLISSNDLSGFTFRGRFLTADQACSVGFEVTQKAHYALRWLLSRQGFKAGDQAVVAWATSGETIPDPLADGFALLGLAAPDGDCRAWAQTAQDLALRLKKRIAGYGTNLGDTSRVVVLALHSATPGRMAVTYFHVLTGSDFLERIEAWHESCAWLHSYRSAPAAAWDGKNPRWIRVPFVGAPSPRDIAEAAYGPHVDDKLRHATVQRILPCIIDGMRIPHDLVESAGRRARNRAGMDEKEWDKTLTIACALFRKWNEKESYTMSLDPNRTTRDYLYGRLLALAESMEQWALNEAGEQRQTNAARLMQRFSERPFSTWRVIELSLEPSKARLGGKVRKRLGMIDEVLASFQPEDFMNDRRLSGEFLLGYHCQREALRSQVRVDEKAAIE